MLPNRIYYSSLCKLVPRINFQGLEALFSKIAPSSFTLFIVSLANFHLANPHEDVSLEVLKACFNRWLCHHVQLEWEAEVTQMGEVELCPGEHEISFSLLVTLTQ